MNASAPNLMTSETSLAIRASAGGVNGVRTNSPQRLRVNRFAVAMDMMAAGTRAPMPMAARQKPANHSGNMRRKSSGTTAEVSFDWMPAASAIRPSSATRPSRMLYAGMSAVLRRMTFALDALRIPVKVGGYKSSAIAEPIARGG